MKTDWFIAPSAQTAPSPKLRGLRPDFSEAFWISCAKHFECFDRVEKLLYKNHLPFIENHN